MLNNITELGENQSDTCKYNFYLKGGFVGCDRGRPAVNTCDRDDRRLHNPERLRCDPFVPRISVCLSSLSLEESLTAHNPKLGSVTTPQSHCLCITPLRTEVGSWGCALL